MESDLVLINRCLKGETAVFTEIISRYKKIIWQVTYNLVDDKQEINDLCQEIWLKIYQSLYRYNHQFKFSTWCAKIATNYCLDYLRKKRIKVIPLQEAAQCLYQTETPEDRFIAGEQRDRIMSALRKLPQKYRVVIVLFHQMELSYKEITGILNLPMTVVKNRLFRARLLLRDRFLASGKEEI